MVIAEVCCRVVFVKKRKKEGLESTLFILWKKLYT